MSNQLISILGPTGSSQAEDNPRFNVFGSEDGSIFLQGNVTIPQMEALKKEIEECLKANKS